MGKLLLKVGTSCRELLVGGARILHGREDEQAAVSWTLDDAGRPVGHLLLRRAAMHVANPRARVGLDAEEHLPLWRHHFVASLCIALERLAEDRRPLRQVLDVGEERKRPLLGGRQRQSMRARVHLLISCWYDIVL